MALLNGFDFIVPVTDVVLSTAASWAQNARGKERFHNSPQSAWRHRELRRTARGGPGALGKAAAVHLRRRRSAAAGVVGQQQPAPADQRARRTRLRVPARTARPGQSPALPGRSWRTGPSRATIRGVHRHITDAQGSEFGAAVHAGEPHQQQRGVPMRGNRRRPHARDIPPRSAIKRQ